MFTNRPPENNMNNLQENLEYQHSKLSKNKMLQINISKQKTNCKQLRSIAKPKILETDKMMYINQPNQVTKISKKERKEYWKPTEIIATHLGTT